MRLDTAAALAQGIAHELDRLAGDLNQYANVLGWLDALDCVAFGSFRPGDRVVARVRRPCDRTWYVLGWWQRGRPHVRSWDVDEPRAAMIPEGDLRHYWDHLAAGDVAHEFDRHQERWTP